MRPATLLAAFGLVFTSLTGCACDPAIIDNRSDTVIEVTVWAPTGGFIFPTVEKYRAMVGAGERWRASCTDRVDYSPVTPTPMGVRVETIVAGGVGRIWLIEVEQPSPWRLRVLGKSDELRFESVREDGVVRSSQFLKVKEEALLSGAE